MLLGSFRSEFEARIVALESVKEQSIDVLQGLYAESQLQTSELACFANKSTVFSSPLVDTVAASRISRSTG